MSNEPVYGLTLGAVECDALMGAMKPERVEPERDLFTAKWWDYRFLHPVHATYLYVDAYDRVLREVWAKHRDHHAAQGVKLLKGKDAFDPRNASKLTGLWRGRQHADALGMPYATYIRLAFEIVLRAWRQSFLPGPQQLYGDRVLDRIGGHWEQARRVRLVVASHQNFRVHRYVGLVCQDEHRAWCLEQAALRPDPAPALGRLIAGDLVPESMVHDRFGVTLVERALTFAN